MFQRWCLFISAAVCGLAVADSRWLLASFAFAISAWLVLDEDAFAEWRDTRRRT